MSTNIDWEARRARERTARLGTPGDHVEYLTRALDRVLGRNAILEMAQSALLRFGTPDLDRDEYD